MAEQRDSKFGPLLITGLLAVLGTVAGGVVKGYWDTSLADRRFQADLVMKALESPDQSTRVASLRFMIETHLISDDRIRAGLEQYLQKTPGTLPQFKPAGLTAGVVVPSTPETVGNTDVDVFVCDGQFDQPPAMALAEAVVTTVKDNGGFGRIKLKAWNFYDEVSLDRLRDRLTIVVDRSHGEARDAERLAQRFRASTGLPDVQVVDNAGRETPWLISVIVCPSR